MLANLFKENGWPRAGIQAGRECEPLHEIFGGWKRVSRRLQWRWMGEDGARAGAPEALSFRTFVCLLKLGIELRPCSCKMRVYHWTCSSPRGFLEASSSLAILSWSADQCNRPRTVSIWHIPCVYTVCLIHLTPQMNHCLFSQPFPVSVSPS